MNSPRSTPNYRRDPPAPEPIPTAWAESELREAHNHRKNLLNNCTKCGELSDDLIVAMDYAKEVETELTRVEGLYNSALIKLNNLTT